MEEKNLDTKTMVAMTLMFMLLMWLMFQQPQQQPEQKTKQESAQNVSKKDNNNFKSQNVVLSDSVSLTKYKNSLGAFAYSASLPSAKDGVTTTLENELLLVKVSNKGGQIVELQVKNQKTYKGEPLFIIKDNNHDFSMDIYTSDNRTLNTKNLYFEPSLSGNKLSMKLKVSDNQYLEYLYTLKPNEYMIDFDLRSQGLSSYIIPSKSAKAQWKLTSRRMEKSVTYEDRYTQAIFNYDKDRVEKLSETSDEEEKGQDSKWISFKQHLFTSYLISDKNFSSLNIKSKKLVAEEKESEKVTKSFSAEFPISAKSGDFNENYHFYFGPADYYTLDKYEKYNLADAIPLGWGIFGWINRWFVMPVFYFLSKYMSIGVAIIVLTVLVRIILSPIQYKSYVSQAKMKIIKPEIDEINTKFKDNPMKRQQETMTLQSKAGVNPLSGCIPALLQMPVFFALFNFFPSAFALRQQNFLWVNDLASYDSIYQLPFSIPLYGDHVSLLPILTSIALLIYTLMTASQMQQPQQEGMPDMRFMMYLSPLMMLFFFNNYGSGLSLYYFISNLITIFIMLAIKYFFIDEKKIHQQIELNRQKPKKESSFQKRMREMMEQAQEQQKRQQKK